MSASMQPMYGAPPAPAPAPVFERLVMVKQGQEQGGPVVGDGMSQSGPAVSARTAFLSELSSYVTADMNHIIAGPTNYWDTPLPLWAPLGQIAGKDLANSGETLYIDNQPLSGRFNTSENANGNWLESASGWEITLSAPRTAFGCYAMDLGDVREGQLEFRLFNGPALVRILQLPFEDFFKPRSDQAMWIGWWNASNPFDRIQAYIRQYSINPSQRDFVGFDDFAVGFAPNGKAPAQLFYGANTSADAAKAVEGAALSARNAWVSAAGSTSVCTFEAASVGIFPTNGLPLPFTGAGGTFNANCTGRSEEANHAISITNYVVPVVAEGGSSNRWNTTPSGSKWLEFTSELDIVFPLPRTSIGFYITDLGDANATLRVTLVDEFGAAVSHYVPKAAALPGAPALLRFWGVVNDIPFSRVFIHTVYYNTLTEHEYRNPLTSISTADIVGIDDIMVA